MISPRCTPWVFLSESSIFPLLVWTQSNLPSGHCFRFRVNGIIIRSDEARRVEKEVLEICILRGRGIVEARPQYFADNSINYSQSVR